MLGLGDDGVVCGERITLQAAYHGQSQLTGEVGVFAVVLFDASPAGIAGEVKDRGEDHADAGGAGLRGDGCAGGGGELRVPGGGETDGRGEDGSAEPVQAFLGEEDGNAEAGILDDPGLNVVVLRAGGVEVVNGADAEGAEGRLRGRRLEAVGLELGGGLVCARPVEAETPR